MKKILVLLAAFIMTFGINLHAQDENTESKGKDYPDENPLMHYAGLELGSTTIIDHYSSLHFGLTYEMKKLKGRNGIGFFLDYMLGPGTEVWFGFPISLHDFLKIDNLVFSIAPGIGITHSLNYKKSETSDISAADKMLPGETRQNLLLKTSFSYVFPIYNSQKKETMRIEPYVDIFLIANYNTYVSVGSKFKFDIYGK